jgi:hypothetical protein
MGSNLHREEYKDSFSGNQTSTAMEGGLVRYVV